MKDLGFKQKQFSNTSGCFLFDTHCHLGGTELSQQSVAIVERAMGRGVRGFCIISADEQSLIESNEQKIFLQKHFAQENLVIRSSAGIHPHDAEKLDEKGWKQVEKYAQNSEAIGETGLDYYYNHSDRKKQIEVFEKHIELSIRLEKPLVIHCRNAVSDVLQILEKYKNQYSMKKSPGILHCFTEDVDAAKKLIDLNFSISFSGIVTFKNAEKIREALKMVPLSHLLIETDSPWLAPVPVRGKTNEPAFVEHVFRFVAELRTEDPEQIKENLWRNSCEMFFSA
jgi:TatD DNase family protein